MSDSTPALPAVKSYLQGRCVTLLNCQECNAPYWAETSKAWRSKFCSKTCHSANTARTQDRRGEKNSNWKNGISKNHYHYKKLQVQRYPERVNARKKVCDAVKAGKLKRLPCEKCGTEPTFAHHEDYSKPLKVHWLCRSCHKAEHQEIQRSHTMVTQDKGATPRKRLKSLITKYARLGSNQRPTASKAK